MACEPRVLCERCNASILVTTATRTGGLCMPCREVAPNKGTFIFLCICGVLLSPLLLIVILYFWITGLFCGLLETIHYCYVELFIRSKFSHIENGFIVCKKHLFYASKHSLNDIDRVRIIRYHEAYDVVLCRGGDEKFSFYCSVDKVADLNVLLDRSVSQIVREDPYELIEET